MDSDHKPKSPDQEEKIILAAQNLLHQKMI
jgi:hypothetical protein